MLMSEQAKIIDIAENIFQNVGIRRWIDQIESLRNYQIYSEICKIIFPQTMIRLIQISQSQKTTGEKIQQVINIISRNFRLDLNHISGVQIANGNLVSLRYWLELLSAISNTFIPTTSRSDVQSAPPENSTTDQCLSSRSFYTAIGVPGEFISRAIYSTNSDQTEQTKSLPKSESRKSNDVMPLKPIGDKDFQKKKPNQKMVKFAEDYKKTQPKDSNKRTKAQSTRNSESETKIKSQTDEINYVCQRKVQYVRKVHNVIQELEKKKFNEAQKNYILWENTENKKQVRIINGIENSSKARNNYINKKIMKREEIMQELREEENALKGVIGMFKSEKRQYKQSEKEEQRKMKEEVDELINSFNNDEAMKKAFRQTLSTS